MDSIKDISQRILLDPRYADFLALLKGARNGAVYGAKVRFPHALVMVFLFRSALPFRAKLSLILKSTRTHARNLATYALLYKSCMLFLRHASPKKSESSHDTFLAGLIGGYAVFGRGIQSSVNQQIVTYVFARVMLAWAKLSVKEGRGIVPEKMRDRVAVNAWPVFAALSWGCVMWLYRWHPETIQPSLKNSMKYIYVDSNYWDCFRNFLIHNQ